MKGHAWLDWSVGVCFGMHYRCVLHDECVCVRERGKLCYRMKRLLNFVIYNTNNHHYY